MRERLNPFMAALIALVGASPPTEPATRALQPGSAASIKYYYGSRSDQSLPNACASQRNFTYLSAEASNRQAINIATAWDNSRHVLVFGHYNACGVTTAACQNALPLGEAVVSLDGGATWSCGGAGPAFSQLSRVDATLVPINRTYGAGGGLQCSTFCIAGGLYGDLYGQQRWSSEVWCSGGGDVASVVTAPWVSAAPLPVGVRGATFVNAGGLVLLVGGERQDGSDAVWVATFAPTAGLLDGDISHCVPTAWVPLPGTAGVLGHRAIPAAAWMANNNALVVGGGLRVLVSGDPSTGVWPTYSPTGDNRLLRLLPGTSDVPPVTLQATMLQQDVMPFTFPVNAPFPARNDSSLRSTGYFLFSYADADGGGGDSLLIFAPNFVYMNVVLARDPVGLSTPWVPRQSIVFGSLTQSPGNMVAWPEALLLSPSPYAMYRVTLDPVFPHILSFTDSHVYRVSRQNCAPPRCALGVTFGTRCSLSPYDAACLPCTTCLGNGIDRQVQACLLFGVDRRCNNCSVCPPGRAPVPGSCLGMQDTFCLPPPPTNLTPSETGTTTGTATPTLSLAPSASPSANATSSSLIPNGGGDGRPGLTLPVPNLAVFEVRPALWFGMAEATACLVALLFTWLLCVGAKDCFCCFSRGGRPVDPAPYGATAVDASTRPGGAATRFRYSPRAALCLLCLPCGAVSRRPGRHHTGVCRLLPVALRVLLTGTQIAAAAGLAAAMLSPTGPESFPLLTGAILLLLVLSVAPLVTGGMVVAVLCGRPGPWGWGGWGTAKPADAGSSAPRAPSTSTAGTSPPVGTGPVVISASTSAVAAPSVVPSLPVLLQPQAADVSAAVAGGGSRRNNRLSRVGLLSSRGGTSQLAASQSEGVGGTGGAGNADWGFGTPVPTTTTPLQQQPQTAPLASPKGAAREGLPAAVAACLHAAIMLFCALLRPGALLQLLPPLRWDDGLGSTGTGQRLPGNTPPPNPSGPERPSLSSLLRRLSLQCGRTSGGGGAAAGPHDAGDPSVPPPAPSTSNPLVSTRMRSALLPTVSQGTPADAPSPDVACTPLNDTDAATSFSRREATFRSRLATVALAHTLLLQDAPLCLLALAALLLQDRRSASSTALPLLLFVLSLVAIADALLPARRAEAADPEPPAPAAPLTVTVIRGTGVGGKRYGALPDAEDGSFPSSLRRLAARHQPRKQQLLPTAAAGGPGVRGRASSADGSPGSPGQSSSPHQSGDGGGGEEDADTAADGPPSRDATAAFVQSSERRSVVRNGEVSSGSGAEGSHEEEGEEEGSGASRSGSGGDVAKELRAVPAPPGRPRPGAGGGIGGGGRLSTGPLGQSAGRFEGASPTAQAPLFNFNRGHGSVSRNSGRASVGSVLWGGRGSTVPLGEPSSSAATVALGGSPLSHHSGPLYSLHQQQALAYRGSSAISGATSTTTGLSFGYSPLGSTFAPTPLPQAGSGWDWGASPAPGFGSPLPPYTIAAAATLPPPAGVSSGSGTITGATAAPLYPTAPVFFLPQTSGGAGAPPQGPRPPTAAARLSRTHGAPGGSGNGGGPRCRSAADGRVPSPQLPQQQHLSHSRGRGGAASLPPSFTPVCVAAASLPPQQQQVGVQSASGQQQDGSSSSDDADTLHASALASLVSSGPFLTALPKMMAARRLRRREKQQQQQIARGAGSLLPTSQQQQQGWAPLGSQWGAGSPSSAPSSPPLAPAMFFHQAPTNVTHSTSGAPPLFAPYPQQQPHQQLFYPPPPAPLTASPPSLSSGQPLLAQPLQHPAQVVSAVAPYPLHQQAMRPMQQQQPLLHGYHASSGAAPPPSDVALAAFLTQLTCESVTPAGRRLGAMGLLFSMAPWLMPTALTAVRDPRGLAPPWLALMDRYDSAAALAAEEEEAEGTPGVGAGSGAPGDRVRGDTAAAPSPSAAPVPFYYAAPVPAGPAPQLPPHAHTTSSPAPQQLPALPPLLSTAPDSGGDASPADQRSRTPYLNFNFQYDSGESPHAGAPSGCSSSSGPVPLIDIDAVAPPYFDHVYLPAGASASPMHAPGYGAGKGGGSGSPGSEPRARLRSGSDFSSNPAGGSSSSSPAGYATLAAASSAGTSPGRPLPA